MAKEFDGGDQATERDHLREVAADYLISYDVLNGRIVSFVLDDTTPDSVIDELEKRVGRSLRTDTPPDISGFINSLIDYFGLDKAEDLMRAYPTYVRALDGQRWDIAQDRMGKMLSDNAVAQAEYDDVQAMWDQYHLPRPETV